MTESEEKFTAAETAAGDRPYGSQAQAIRAFMDLFIRSEKGAHSVDELIAAPFMRGGEIIGFPGADNPKEHTDHQLFLSAAAAMPG